MKKKKKKKAMGALERKLWLLRNMKVFNGWVSSLEIVVMYSEGLRLSERTARRSAERDLHALERAGVPIEHKPGYWRLSKQSFSRWVNCYGC